MKEQTQKQDYYDVYLQHPNNKPLLYFMQIRPTLVMLSLGQKHIRDLDHNDIIGVHVNRQGQELYKLTISSFPKRTSWLRKQRRCLETIDIWLEISQKQIEHIKINLLKKITNRNIKSQQELRLLAYFNPNAGSNSKSHLQNIAKIAQKYTNFKIDVVFTQRRNHCKEHLATIDTKKYQGVLIISGDGLMHEFVNSQVCGRLPVVQVPAGSGNAFCKTQTNISGEQCTDQTALYIAVKGKITQLNLIKMQLQNEPAPIYSFLSLQWAFLADIDMNSQFLRILGGLRFQVYSAYRCLALQRYQGKLTYSHQQSQLPPLDKPLDGQNYQTIETTFLNAIFCFIPFISDKYNFAPLLEIKDRDIDMQIVTQAHGRWALVKYLLSAQDGGHFDKQTKTVRAGFNFGHAKIKSFRLQPSGQNKGIFGIDGQRYQAQRMQAGVSQRKLLAFY